MWVEGSEGFFRDGVKGRWAGGLLWKSRPGWRLFELDLLTCYFMFTDMAMDLGVGRVSMSNYLYPPSSLL